MRLTLYFLLLLMISTAVEAGTSLPITAYGAYGWKLSFQDEFNGAEEAIKGGTSSDCFTMLPQCLDSWWSYSCDLQQVGQLRDLNKCNWLVFDRYNWMDYDAPLGGGTNSFHPSQVEVKDGVLHLYATRSPYQGTQMDCKNEYFETAHNSSNLTKKCPIWSGGIQSSHFWYQNKKFGFDQEYGRFEVRAKSQSGPGSWPAAWILASDLSNEPPGKCGWPYNGELDLLEAVASEPGGFYSTYHDGNCPKKIHLSKGFRKEVKDYYNDFHTYVVEWSPTSVQFIFDEVVLGTVVRGQIVKGKIEEKIPTEGRTEIPVGPFYWILNNTILNTPSWPIEARPDLALFQKQDFQIDYVRTFSACDATDAIDDCKHFIKYMSDADKSEKAAARIELSFFPNPVLKGVDPNLLLVAFQDCSSVRLEIFNDLGARMVAFESEGFAMRQNETKFIKVPSGNLDPGLYYLAAFYKQCGVSRQDSGKNVIPFLIR